MRKLFSRGKEALAIGVAMGLVIIGSAASGTDTQGAAARSGQGGQGVLIVAHHGDGSGERERHGDGSVSRPGGNGD